MSKSSDRAEAQAAQQARDAATAQQTALVSQIGTDDPLTAKYKAIMSKRLDFFSQGSPDYDLSKTDKDGNPAFPGGPVFSSAATREARAQRDSDKAGIGALAMGSHGTDSGQLNQLKEQRVRHESQDASLDAADAVNQARAETFGSVLPLDQARTSRYGVALGGAGTELGYATDRWNNRPKPFAWQSLIGPAIGAGAQIATGI